jgi:predicted phosphodiesterase
MTRLAILSDMHGDCAATAMVLAAIHHAAPDAVYCLGDLVGYGPRPNDVIDVVRDQDTPTIMGNYDDGVGFDRVDCGCAYKGERTAVPDVDPRGRNWPVIRA